MRFKLDENIPRDVEVLLRSVGHDTEPPGQRLWIVESNRVRIRD